MRTILILLCQLMLASCEFNQYEAYAKNGNVVRETGVVIGSTYSSRRADGSSRVYDGQDSFRTGAALAAGGIAAKFDYKTQQSNNQSANYTTAAGVASKPPTILTNTKTPEATVNQVAIPFVPPKQP